MIIQNPEKSATGVAHSKDAAHQIPDGEAVFGLRHPCAALYFLLQATYLLQ